MKKIGVIAAGILAVGVLAVSGCNDAGTAQKDSSAAEEVSSTIRSKVQFEGSYLAGETVQIRMFLDKEGNCDYGFTGQYSMEKDEDGNQLLKLCYYITEDSSQSASDTYVIRENKDGTYDRAKYTEGEKADFSDAAVLTLQEGEDGILGTDFFDGVYVSSGGSYMELCEDGSFMLGVHMKYAADKKQFEMIGADSSAVYDYETDDDQNHIVLKNADGQTVMDLKREE